MTEQQCVLVFDGKDDYVNIRHSNTFNVDAVTLELWFQWTEEQGNTINFLCSKNLEELEIHIGGGGGTFGIRFIPTTGVYLDTGDNRFKSQEWVHVAAVYDPSQSLGKMYINGEDTQAVASGSQPLTTPITKSTSDFLLGVRINNTYHFQGKMAEVRVWNKVRTQAEIQQSMKRRLIGTEAGLVAYIPMSECSGSIANDKTTNSNNGTINGATWQQDDQFLEREKTEQQWVLSFDGVDDYIEVQDPFENTTTFTISLWVKPSLINDGGWHGFIGKQGDQYRRPSLWLCPSNAGLYYDSYSLAGQRYGEQLNNFFEKDQWIHIAWVKQGTEYRFYRNGELFDTKSAPDTFYNPLTSYWIGRVDNFWFGLIAEVRIWNYARTPEEIKASMNYRLQGNEAGLVGYWPLNEGSGNTVADKTSKANNGTINGATWQQQELPVQPAPEPITSLTNPPNSAPAITRGTGTGNEQTVASISTGYMDSTMPTYKTPNVYVEEISTFPPSVAEVSTAIPAFIGNTEKALKGEENLTKKPTRISSILDYEVLFGGAKATTFDITIDDQDQIAPFTPPEVENLMYYALRMYFDNGGGSCYIVSVGSYNTPATIADFRVGLDALKKEDEPTLILLTDAIKLPDAEYHELCQAALVQCNYLKDRFVIFDVKDSDNGVDNFRQGIGTEYLQYGAAYHPYLQTSLKYYYTDDSVTINAGTTLGNDSIKKEQTELYNRIRAELDQKRVVLPPSSAVAGVYARVDRDRGVWKAPANVSLASVIGPTLKITNEEQENLNVDPTAGKSINAIRNFTGKGTLIWGARTLAGNDNEWRYIPVRRLFNLIEESLQKATAFVVFELNNAVTWLKVKTMIETYLEALWRQGALVGATPEQAFFVNVGLGKSMTAQDILEGRLIVEIGIAAVRPTEFVILKFSHQLQEA